MPTAFQSFQHLIPTKLECLWHKLLDYNHPNMNVRFIPEELRLGEIRNRTKSQQDKKNPSQRDERLVKVYDGFES